MTADFLEPQSGDVVVVLPAAALVPIWQVLRDELQRRQHEGGQVRPDVERAVAILRSAASSALAMSATGPDSRTSPDITAQSELLGTGEAADALGYTARHMRRLAKAEGIEPAARGTWRRTDIDELRRRKEAS